MKFFITLFIVFVLAGAVGWANNLIALFNCDFKAPYKAEVIRTVGVFVPPLGAVVGWAHIED